MAVIYALLAGMYASGIWERRHSLDPTAMRWGVSLNYQAAISAVGLAALCLTNPFNLRAALAIVLVVGVAAALREPVVSRITGMIARG